MYSLTHQLAQKRNETYAMLPFIPTRAAFLIYVAVDRPLEI